MTSQSSLSNLDSHQDPTLKLAEVAMVSHLPFLYHCSSLQCLMTQEKFTSIRRIVGPHMGGRGGAHCYLTLRSFHAPTNIDPSAAVVHTIPTRK